MHATCTTHPPAPRERVRREPERTALYQVLQEHLGPFLAHADVEGSGLPRFVRRELQAFLDCGILERGFARLRCPDCRHESVVAFSCKGRGFCPSCGGRRMAETAAHLVDHVLPGEVPYRQWVLTVDHRLRYQMAHGGDLCSAVLREFIRALFNDLRRRARRVGVRRPRPGAVTCIQRFSSNLATNVHFHTLVPDGVFTADRDGTATFHPLAPPTPADIERVARRIRRRVLRLLRRLGRLPAESAAAEEPDALALAEPVLAWCLAASVAGRVAIGPRTGRPLDRDGVLVADWSHADDNPWCAQIDGFNLHAGVTVKAGERDRLEHLCRYMARPAIAQDRLTLTADGRVAYRLKRPWRDGSTHVFFEPLDFIARLVGLIPAPGRNLTRYHGVFAPNAKLRPAVVPAATTSPGDAMPRRPSSAQYVTWAALMQRVFGIDVLRCTRCGGTLRLIAFIHSPKVAAAILASLSTPRAAGRPRAPP